MIEIKNVTYSYPGATQPAIKDMSLQLDSDSFVALVGHNGSGKSTIARLLNGLILPHKGQVLVDGMNTLDRTVLLQIRKTIGVVFQNPDNQTVATIVEDDVAFGPENIGVPRNEIRERVDWALQAVGMYEHRKGTHTRLSGGQKQRVAIAAILALRPKVIVLDESTSMLDPKGRQGVLSVVQELNRRDKIGVIMITHFMEEAQLADRIVVIDSGKVLMDGGCELFEYRDQLVQAGLALPPYAELATRLGLKGIRSEDQLVDAIVKQKKPKTVKDCNTTPSVASLKTKPIVQSKNLSFVYSAKTSFAKVALDKVDIEINEGDYCGIVGHTGSGKTTFVGHLNALIKLQSGELSVCEIDLTQKFKHKQLRSQVGMVFQYPEYQLFDETVAKDIAFGPKNLKLDPKEIDQRVREAIKLVGLDYDTIADKSPFDLSGGQKRRVAIAGVIAMRPKVLVLDEPTAGLDPRGKQEILDLVCSLKAQCPTVIMISHNMDEIAQYCNKVALFGDGKLLQLTTPQELFAQQQLLKDLHLDIPAASRITSKLIQKGIKLDRDIVDIEQLIKQF